MADISQTNMAVIARGCSEVSLETANLRGILSPSVNAQHGLGRFPRYHPFFLDKVVEHIQIILILVVTMTKHRLSLSKVSTS